MKGIVTVLGRDQMGIIAKVCTYLSNNGINIMDISQSIVGGYFNMMMIVDLGSSGKAYEDMAAEMEQLGKDIGVVIKVQHEDIFNSMHTV